MENRLLTTILALTALIAVLALAAVGLFRPAQTVTAQPGVSNMPQIVVIGSGEVKVEPDIATITIGVETKAPTTQEALAQNSAQAQAIIDRIRQLGVEAKDIQTTGISIYPVYDEQGQNITGYTVSNMVNVTVRNIAQAGDLIDQVVQVGANRLYGVSFGVSDMEAVLAKAREAAVANARARAEQMARASGTSLGRVLFITENFGASPIPMPMAADAYGSAARSAPPVQPGQQTYSATVQVTFELR
ncbi:SIMPL domain-containing protein [Chloroflexus sp.]|uniref:SIMPL domain-containing protein n=1 Tax=Chloroflexus sp. TaxID=1904827 RepID=UPI00298EF816|nr:SIMPL domain-containing protein [Chloroflexus sp.]MCS6888514.1 SIMPL domain-containing protein [Chloroflexus sp.]MDW8405462.1 SIMPL domain-containing protein [Chloroflexus sp.]